MPTAARPRCVMAALLLSTKGFHRPPPTMPSKLVQGLLTPPPPPPPLILALPRAASPVPPARRTAPPQQRHNLAHNHDIRSDLCALLPIAPRLHLQFANPLEGKPNKHQSPTTNQHSKAKQTSKETKPNHGSQLLVCWPAVNNSCWRVCVCVCGCVCGWGWG